MSELEAIKKIKSRVDTLKKQLSTVIVGQEEVIEQILISIVCDANALLESNPGLGKTLTIKTIAKLLELKFSRVQNTPDLMPSDITGTYVIQEVNGKKSFIFEKGPIFTNILLADEINRATPKTQAALLEAMEEKQVTVGKQTFPLDSPFFVLATQNPIDQEGTYPLPEAQVDRFLLKILVDYPKNSEELEIVNKYTQKITIPQLTKVFTAQDLKNLQTLARQVPIADDIKRKVVELIHKTRTKKELIEYAGLKRKDKPALVIIFSNIKQFKKPKQLDFPITMGGLYVTNENKLTVLGG